MFSIGEQIEGGNTYIRDSLKWTTKSLTSNPSQQYGVPVSLTGPHTTPYLTPTEAPVPTEPIPITTKITDKVFTLHTYSSLTVFTFTDKSKGSKFSFKTFDMDVSGLGIRQVLGSPVGVFVVVGEKMILGYEVANRVASEIWKKEFVGIKCGGLVQSQTGLRLLVLMQETLHIYSMCEGFSLLVEVKFDFIKPQQRDLYLKLQPINIVIQNSREFFLLGTTIEQRKQIKRSRQEEQPSQAKQCEVLHIAKFMFKENLLFVKSYTIDHIFQLNMFKRSRAFAMDPQTFALALHEQFILIKKNFDRYIVEDNVSVGASKSSEKKGQLVLACEEIVLFEDSEEISAVLTEFQNEKISLKLIDTLRGNDNEDEVLYSSLVLEKQKCLMVILLYFKAVDIFIPNKPAKFIKTNLKTKQNGKKGPSKLNFKLVLLEQRDPVTRLKELLRQEKTPEQIQLFKQRFFIRELVLKKSEWEVSLKTQKEIESLLMEIPDNQYIQDEINKIMKESDHELNFLLSVEKNQVDRYRRMVSQKLLNLSERQLLQATSKNKKNIQKSFKKKSSKPQFSQSQKEEIKLAMQWLLQSKMMQKKLFYSLSFLTFKQYSFIQIGKLKAASLKEQIKLLCCKGYEKRLKYFMNSFKYLALDDFSMILKFVISGMNQKEVESFFTLSFPFLLPLYQSPETTPPQDRCKLWKDNFDQDEKNIQTLECFQQQIKQQIQRTCGQVPDQFLHWSSETAFSEFRQIFQEFTQENWFKKNAYKQHSILKNNLKDLKNNFYYMKKCGICNTIVQFLYQGVESGNFTENLARQTIESLTTKKLFSHKYTQSIRARLQVYDLLYFEKNRPTRPQFLNMGEPEYFSYLFNINKKMLFTSVKAIYDGQQAGFFVERFQEYLQSEKVVLKELIESIEMLQEYKNIQAVKQRVFVAVKRLLCLKDAENTQQFVSKLLELQILGTKDSIVEQQAKQEAKIALGFNFHQMFVYFDINNTYQELIDQTERVSMQESQILSPLMEKYCAKKLDHLLKNDREDKPEQILKISSKFDLLKVSQINLCEALDFFSLLLEFTILQEFKINETEIFNKYIEELFENQKFNVVEDFINYFLQFGHVIEERDLIEQYENYKFIQKFKQENNLKHLLLDFVLKWVQKKYQYIASFTEVQPKSANESNSEKIPYHKVCSLFISISKSLSLLKKFVVSDDVEEAISTISLFQSLKNLEITLLLPAIKAAMKNPEKFLKQSGFIFMINLIYHVPLSILSEMKQSKPILEFFHALKLIYKDFKIITRVKSSDQQKIGDRDYSRFFGEMTAYFINNALFQLSTFGLAELIRMKNGYSREILFYFLSRTWKSMISVQEIMTLVRQFYVVETPQLLEKHLGSFIGRNRISDFVQPQKFKSNTEPIFGLILDTGHIEEAYYFLYRCEEIKVSESKPLAMKIKKFDPQKIFINQLIVCYFRILKKYMINDFYPTFFLYQNKVGLMARPYERQIIIKDINIAIMKLQVGKINPSKYCEEDLQQFIQVYEDYMKKIGEDPQLKLIKMEEDDEPGTLKYERYARKKSHKNAIFTSPTIDQLIGEERTETMQLRKRILEDDERLREIQQQNKQLLIQNQIRPYISEIKAQELEKKIKQQERKKQQAEREKQIEKNNEQLDVLNINIKGVQTEEKQKLQDVKKNYTSKLYDEAKQIVHDLRKKRVQTKGGTLQTLDKQESEGRRSGHDFLNPNQKKPVQTSLKNLQSSKFLDPLHFRGDRKMRESYYDVLQRKSSQILLDQVKNLRSSHLPAKAFSKDGSSHESHIQIAPNVGLSESLTPNEINIKVTDPDKHEKLNNQYKPRTFVPKRHFKEPLAFTMERVHTGSQSNLIAQSREQLEILKEKSNEALRQSLYRSKKQDTEVKISFEQIMTKFTKTEPKIIPFLSKIKYITNSVKTAQQLIRNIYKSCEKLEHFVQLVEDLLHYSDFYKEVLEPKATIIVKQAMSIKIQISLKQLFFADFFLSIYNLAMRDYYQVAFNSLKVNLPKLFISQDFNLTRVAAMIRSAFGSDFIYLYKFHEEYLKFLTKQYKAGKVIVGVLAQKFRTTLKNMNPDNRMIKVQQIINELNNVELERGLISAINKNIEHKKSLMQQQEVNEWKVILTRLNVV